MKKKIGFLFLLRVVKIGLSIVSLGITAKYFGISHQRDQWILAMNGIIVLDLALWGPINETFRTKFIYIREAEGEKAALTKASSLLTFSVCISAILVSLIMLFPRYLAYILAPGYQEWDQKQLILMIHLIAPSFLVNQASLLLISILNAFDSFFVPEISAALSTVINIALVVLLAPIIGIYSLVYSYYAGIGLLFILLLIQLRKKKIRLILRLNEVKFSDFKVFAIYALPFFLPYFFGQMNTLAEKSISSTLGSGIVSSIDYGRKFSDMAFSVLSGVLVTMLVPVLSKKFAQKEQGGYYEEFTQVYQIGFIIVTLIITMFTSCPDAFVQLFYNRGSISTQALRRISELAMFYSWSGLAIYIYLIFGLALLSSDQRKRYAFYGIFAQVIMIVANYVFVKKINVYVFPISAFIAHAAAGIIMYTYFPYEKKKLIRTTLTYLLVLLITCFGVAWLGSLVKGNSPLTVIATNGFIAALLLLIFLFVFKLDERLFLIRIIQKYRK